jgi:hypothetical protein
MAAMDSIKAKFDEYEYIIKLLTAKAEELAAENERLKSTLGAHGVLKLIYSNPDSPEGNRIKAATAALPHETPKLMPERQALELRAEAPRETLGQIHDRRLERQLAHEGQEIRVAPNGDVVILRPANGNGQDDSSSD